MAFKIGDKLVYPNHGVGVVETIQESLMEGSPAPCYQLRLLGNNSRVMVPVGNSDRIGLRPLTRRKDVGGVFRVIPERPPTIAEIGLPAHLAEIADYHQGLVIVCGPSGSGKSTTLAALVNLFDVDTVVLGGVFILHPVARPSARIEPSSTPSTRARP